MKKILYIFYFVIIYKTNNNYHTVISEAEDKWNMRSHLTVETYLLTFIYNGKELKNFNHILKNFEIVSKDPYPNKLDLQIVFADVDKIPALEQELKINPEENSLIFYIQKIPHKLKDFDKILKKLNNLEKKDDLSKVILNFIKETMEDLSTELNNISEIETLLLKNKIIPIYLGLQNYHYGLYKLFASKHKERVFYHTFNKALIAKLYRRYTTKEQSKKDAFAILREDSLITKYDKDKLVFMTQLYSTRSLNHFYDYEIYPKLRNEDFIQVNYDLLYKDVLENMLVYIYNDDRDEQNWEEFQESIIVLPKRFIYSHVNINNEKFSIYQKLFDQAGVEIKMERLYAIHVLKNGKVICEEFKEVFSKPNITKFVMDYYEQKIKKLEEDVIREDELNEL